MRTEHEFKMLIIDKAEHMAKILHKGNDCEIRTSPNGIAVIDVNKKVVSK